MGYPLWLCPWREIALVFDGLNQTQYTLPYIAVPDVNAFMENLKRASRTLETYLAFSADSINCFESSTEEKSLITNGLIREPQFLTEFENYRQEAAKTDQGNPSLGFLAPTIDESVISSEIQEIESLYLSLRANFENLTRTMKLLNRASDQYVKQLRDKAKTIKYDFDIRIREEEEVVAPQVTQLKDDHDFQMVSLAKSFGKRLLPIQNEKARLEKSREHAVARIRQCKLQAKSRAEAGQRAAEAKWKEKTDKTRKELSEIEKKLNQTEKLLKDLEEQRTLETFKLREDLETKVKEARKSILELEASRDAKILIKTQEVQKLEEQTRLTTDQIARTIKVQEAEVSEFEKLGVKKDLGLERCLLYYLPFYIICYGIELKKRYVILSPSVVNTVGVLTKLKGILGMARIKSLLEPRFKAFTSLVDSIQVLMVRRAIFETELRELGTKNNMLGTEAILIGTRKGLELLKSEGWLSEKEFDVIKQRLAELG
jgi:hypothetical protein